MIESATGATFAAQKQESPDAKVPCPSGCCRIIVAYRCSVLLIQPAVITTFALYDLMALFAQKCHAPPAVVESSRLIGIAHLR